jgi:hypothetical protein
MLCVYMYVCAHQHTCFMLIQFLGLAGSTSEEQKNWCKEEAQHSQKNA